MKAESGYSRRRRKAEEKLVRELYRAMTKAVYQIVAERDSARKRKGEHA
jgi:hypothetical protein